jgi:GTP-binding protein HflX
VDELGCRDTPTITIYNKQDLCEDEEVVFELDNLPKSDVDSSLSASATSGGGVDALLEAVDAALASQNALVDCLVPFARGDLVEEVHRTGTVERVEHEMEGTRLVARVPEALANRLKEFLVVDDG